MAIPHNEDTFAGYSGEWVRSLFTAVAPGRPAPSVVYSPQPYYDSKKHEIGLPAVPYDKDGAKELEPLFRAFMFHEFAEADMTDYGKRKPVQKAVGQDEEARALCNCINDRRIDGRQGVVFPGYASDVRVALKNDYEGFKRYVAQARNPGLNTLSGAIRYAGLATPDWETLLREIPQVRPLYDRVSDLLEPKGSSYEEALGVYDTDEVSRDKIAKLMVDVLDRLRNGQAPQPGNSGEGEPGDEGEESGEQGKGGQAGTSAGKAGGEQGEGEGQGGEAGESGNAEGQGKASGDQGGQGEGDQGEGQGQQGQGQASGGQGEGKSGGQGQSEQGPQAEGSASGAGTGLSSATGPLGQGEGQNGGKADDANVLKALDGMKNELAKGLNRLQRQDKAGQPIHVLPKEDQYIGSTRSEVEKATKNAPDHKSLARALRASLADVLKGEGMERETGQSKGTFDARRIGHLMAGREDVLRKHRRTPESGRPLVILALDSSSSMADGGQKLLALRTAYHAWMEALRGLGCPVAVGTWCSGGQYVLTRRPMDGSKADFAKDYMFHRGGTEAGPGTAFFADVARAYRKPGQPALIVLLSDGHSSNPELVRQEGDRARADGIAVLPILLGQDFVRLIQHAEGKGLENTSPHLKQSYIERGKANIAAFPDYVLIPRAKDLAGSGSKAIAKAVRRLTMAAHKQAERDARRARGRAKTRRTAASFK